MSINSEHNEEIFERVRCNLGEHFENYMFIVMDEEGGLFLRLHKLAYRQNADEGSQG